MTTKRKTPATKPKRASKRRVAPKSKAGAGKKRSKSHAKTGRPKGPPTAYRPEFADQARMLCALGAIDKELAQFFKIAMSTLYQWKIAQPAFSEALKVGKAEADDRVERSLYQLAVGYTFESEKIFCQDGKVIRAPIVEHVPPNPAACIFWLKNRRRDYWRDRIDNELSGPDGGPIKTENVSDQDLARQIAFILTKATHG
jgi:hypothetical protein